MPHDPRRLPVAEKLPDPAAAASDTGLVLQHVTHRFGWALAIDNLSLKAGPGEIVCLVGPSGCGKSTTLRLAAGLEPLQSGAVRLDGRVMADGRIDIPPERRGIGFVFQDLALFGHLSVAQNVGFGLRHLPATERAKRVGDVLARVHMGRFADAYPHMLSGGEQQRVALARALAPRPRLMLLDEPFSGLDTRLRDAVRDETLALLHAAGAPALFVTHDPAEAMRMADRIVVMRGGRLQQTGDPDTIYHRPANAFVAAFFGPVNTLAARVRQGRAETPLGQVAAPGLADGTAVQVVARCEGLRVGAAGGRPGVVIASRLLGAFSEVTLAVEGLTAPVLAQMQGQAPQAGETVLVAFDPRHIFLFATEAADTPPTATVSSI